MYAKGSESVHASVRLCTANKRLAREEPILANVCRLTRYVRLPIFMQIVDVIDLHYQVKYSNRKHWEVLM